MIGFQRPQPAPTSGPERVIVKCGHCPPGKCAPGCLDYLHGRYGATLLADYPHMNMEVVANTSGMATAAAYCAHSQVAYAQNERSYAPCVVPNDPNYTNEWGLASLHFDVAWDLTKGEQNIKLGVIDTGAQLDHPDLGSRVFRARDFTASIRGADDLSGHGTHVAGIMAAATNNAVGVAGCAWKSQLFVAKAARDADFLFTTTAIIAALDWLVSEGVWVVNMSFGSTDSDQALQDAIRYATGRWITVVAAAGNAAMSGNPLIYPAAYPEVLSVSAIDSALNIASFSEHNGAVFAAAPGVNVYSLWLASTYDYQSGTSMAAPFVSGLVALALAMNATATPDEIRAAIASTALDRGTSGRDDFYGAGVISARDCLRKVSGLIA